ncbi:hypothetical protein CPC08DRAFT_601164, partial [Agrocybe pediades]
HDDAVQDVLFTLCTWHAYAKLRLHTSSSLRGLKSTTKTLGAQLRRFVKKVCPHYHTKELPREEAARARRHANSVKKGKQPATQDFTRKLDKTLNLFTYK